MHIRLLSVVLFAACCAGACSNETTAPPAGDASAEANAMAPTPAPAEAATAAAPPATATDEDASPSPADAVPGADPAAPASPAPAAASAEPAEFDPASVPGSSATLPPFPFFEAPEGLVSTLADKDRNKNFDREHMIAGDRIVAVEGKVFRDRFRLTDPQQREYSDIEFQRNYADAVAALGGVEVSRVQYTHQVNAAFGGRAKVDKHYHGTCASDGCENHTYLIRQGSKEYWIQVSTGAIPLHGEVVVLERQAMTSKLGFLDADAMKQKLDADGRVALYVNFDTDKATLRPDAAPVIDEVAKLLQANPALKLSIDGHTDSTGSAEHNRALSKARAESVRDALLAKGIDAGRLGAQGFGPDKPLADNGSEAGRAKNRRVELVKR